MLPRSGYSQLLQTQQICITNQLMLMTCLLWNRKSPGELIQPQEIFTTAKLNSQARKFREIGIEIKA